MRPVYPSLFRFLPTGTPQPYLAANVTVRRSDALVRLERARWSDGRAITARDVAASARRASPPSGFAGLEVRVLDRRTVRFRGPVGDWERRLATLTFVLPNGRPGVAFGGPFAIDRHVEGYEVLLRRNGSFFGDAARTRELKLRFVQDLDLLLLLLEQGRLDAAAPPASVNLEQRLDEHGLRYEEAGGWESVWVDLSRSPLNRAERASLLSSIRWRELAEAFVRDDGRLVLAAARRDGGNVLVRQTLIGPNGDELLGLILRAAWFQLRDAGHLVELLRVDPDVLYGEWSERAPRGVALRRSAGAPGVADPLRLGPDGRRVFEIASFVAWRDGVGGLWANPTFEGPLWDAGEVHRR